MSSLIIDPSAVDFRAPLRKLDLRGLNCNEVFERIWVGAAPDHGRLVATRGFTHLVLCAVTHQWPPAAFPGTTVIHCPFEDDDSVMSEETLGRVVLAARAVAEAHRAGGNVLVTCRAGINRSALVAALAMQMLGEPPWLSVERLRFHRFEHCLANECFFRLAMRRNARVDHYLGDPS